jgi:hypothetical protein
MAVSFVVSVRRVHPNLRPPKSTAREWDDVESGEQWGQTVASSTDRDRDATLPSGATVLLSMMIVNMESRRLLMKRNSLVPRWETQHDGTSRAPLPHDATAVAFPGIWPAAITTSPNRSPSTSPATWITTPFGRTIRRTLRLESSASEGLAGLSFRSTPRT